MTFESILRDTERKLLADSNERIQAHQLTINGFTYPFVRHHHFAAVPDPPNARQYDMYSGLYLIKPNDIVFFFQADPQIDPLDVNSRRGIRGVYRVVSNIFRDSKSIVYQPNGFKIHGECPNCREFHSNFKGTCPRCKIQYPLNNLNSTATDPQIEPVLASRFQIEPLVIFERTLGDIRAYGDLSDSGLLWIGRHDNAMGPGKGGSIRQLLPEEAIKIIRLLKEEPDQVMRVEPGKSYPNPKESMNHANGKPISHLPLTNSRELSREDMLNYVFSTDSFNQRSKIRNIIKPWLPTTVDDQPEYVSSMFPWGYASNTADFLMLFKELGERSHLLLFEFKKTTTDDWAFLQVASYVRWVIQVISQNCPYPINTMTVYPIVVAKGSKRGHRLAAPKSYTYHMDLLTGKSVDIKVQSSKFISYTPAGVTAAGGEKFSSHLDFRDESALITSIDWIPPTGFSGTRSEMNWAMRGSWKSARINSGLPGP